MDRLSLSGLLGLLLGLALLTADFTRADEVAPSGSGQRWMVTTLFGATYWGTLAIAGANVPGFTLTTGSGKAIVLAQKDVVKALHDEDSTTVDAAQIVGYRCPASRLPGSLVREVVMRGQAPFVAGVKVAKGGRYIRVRRPPATGEVQEPAWRDLEELRTPTGMIDECAMAQPAPAPLGVTQAWDDEAAPQARAKPKVQNPNRTLGIALLTVGGIAVVGGAVPLFYGVLAAKGGPALLGGPSGDSSNFVPALVGGGVSFGCGTALIVGGIVLLDQGPARGLRR